MLVENRVIFLARLATTPRLFSRRALAGTLNPMVEGPEVLIGEGFKLFVTLNAGNVKV